MAGVTIGEGGVPIRGGLPPRNPRFVGREGLLADVRGLLGNGPVVLLSAAEHQLGGTGRTQLAVEYAYRYADTYDLVWWIPAEQTPECAPRWSGWPVSSNCPRPATSTARWARCGTR